MQAGGVAVVRLCLEHTCGKGTHSLSLPFVCERGTAQPGQLWKCGRVCHVAFSRYYWKGGGHFLPASGSRR